MFNNFDYFSSFSYEKIIATILYSFFFYNLKGAEGPIVCI